MMAHVKSSESSTFIVRWLTLHQHCQKGGYKANSRKLGGLIWIHLNQLLERTVDWRANLVALVEFNGGHSALADAFGREFEFLVRVSDQID